MEPEPTITELIAMAREAVHGQADRDADFNTGSDYDILAAVNAIIGVRQARRDTDMFAATTFSGARGDDLTWLVKKRWGIDRILDTPGVGTVVLARSTAGAEMIWEGTRIALLGGSQPKLYRVAENKAVASGDASVTVAIEAVDIGPGSAVSATANLRLEDPTDSNWSVTYLSCAEGTTYEPDAAFRARVQGLLRDRRVGYVTAIENACKAVGAARVLCFRSDFAGDSNDYGLNVVYVGDLGYSTTDSLMKACTKALRSIRVFGDYLQVLPMARVPVNVDIDITLRDSPAVFNLNRLELIHRAAITGYLGGSAGGWTYTLNGLTAAIAKPTPEVQGVSFVTPTGDATLLGGTPLQLPTTLNRYVPGDITIRYQAP